MQYENVIEARFISRPNRFIANIEIDGGQELAHVKNTGRCKELLLPGAKIYVQCHNDAKRKTKFSLLAVEKEAASSTGAKEILLINMDSQAPNKVVHEWLLKQEPFGKIIYLKPECRYGESRFDFYLETAERKMFIEVKGVTLEENSVVMFPDAPTERGVKHVHELCACLQESYEAAIIFVIQMEKALYFTPNKRTHAAFAKALTQAERCGVKILALTCAVTPETMSIKDAVPVNL